MKKITIIITTIILLLTISFFIIPKQTFSNNENRYLETFPEFTIDDLISGNYIEDVENYLTDHFPLRDVFMGIKTMALLLTDQKEINDVYIGEDEYLFLKDQGHDKTEQLIEVLNNFSIINTGKTQLLLIPSSGLINADKLPENITYQQQEEIIEYIYENINIDGINVISSIKEGNKDYQMYYKLDHHYTTFGAYYTYLEYCNKNNLVPVEQDIKEITNNFNGTLYSKSNIYYYQPDKLHSQEIEQELIVKYNDKTTNTIYFDEHLDTKDKYNYFLDGNHPLMTIETEVANNEEILIIKDSYANSFIPFITNHYKKIHVIDLRYYNLKVTDYIEENNITNTLILYGINDIDTDVGIYKLN